MKWKFINASSMWTRMALGNMIGSSDFLCILWMSWTGKCLKGLGEICGTHLIFMTKVIESHKIFLDLRIAIRSSKIWGLNPTAVKGRFWLILIIFYSDFSLYHLPIAGGGKILAKICQLKNHWLEAHSLLKMIETFYFHEKFRGGGWGPYSISPQMCHRLIVTLGFLEWEGRAKLAIHSQL